jgi:hypothetical protein
MIIDGLASFILFFYIAKAEHNNKNMIRIKRIPGVIIADATNHYHVHVRIGSWDNHRLKFSATRRPQRAAPLRSGIPIMQRVRWTRSRERSESFTESK